MGTILFKENNDYTMPLGSESKQARFKMGRMPGTTTIEERLLHSTHNAPHRRSLLKERSLILTQGKPLRQRDDRIVSSGLIEEHRWIAILSSSRIGCNGCPCPQGKERNRHDRLQGTHYKYFFIIFIIFNALISLFCFLYFGVFHFHSISCNHQS